MRTAGGPAEHRETRCECLGVQDAAELLTQSQMSKDFILQCLTKTCVRPATAEHHVQFHPRINHCYVAFLEAGACLPTSAEIPP